MQIQTKGHKVQVTIEDSEEAATLPSLIEMGWPRGASGQRWEITYPFSDEVYSYYVCIDYEVDEWFFYAFADNGYTLPFSSSRGDGLNAAIVCALCRLLTGNSESILMKMYDARLFAEGA